MTPHIFIKKTDDCLKILYIKYKNKDNTVWKSKLLKNNIYYIVPLENILLFLNNFNQNKKQIMQEIKTKYPLIYLSLCI